MNQFRNFAVWIVIALLLFALFSVFQGQVRSPASSELSYSEFLDKANSGAIQSIVLTRFAKAALIPFTMSPTSALADAGKYFSA